VLITPITVPERRMRMTDVAERVLVSPSGMTRAVARLAGDGLVERTQDANDRRSFLVTLTPRGVRRLRKAQETHHDCVRELLFGGLGAKDVRRLAALFDPPA
jgi:DNA-binding MarR family transcriptional regulator